MVNTILARRVNHIVAKGDNPAWPKGSKSRGFSNSISYPMSGYIISRNGRQTKKAYACEIHVRKNWNRVEEVYEDVFDSYSMDLNTFKAQLNARLSEFNDN